jgi:hypothetical protein
MLPPRRVTFFSAISLEAGQIDKKPFLGLGKFDVPKIA